MKLSQVQADLIGVMKLKADQDLKTVARKLKVTEKTVRYHLEYLKKHEVLSSAHFFNLYPLGYRSINMYFSVASQEKQSVDLLLSHLIDSPHVTWLAELGGDFHYGVAFALPKFENTIHELLGVPASGLRSIFEKSLNMHLSLKMYPLKILGSRHVVHADIGYGESLKMKEEDEVGLRLISCMSREPGLSLRDIAKRIGRSPASVSARVQELKKDGIYRGEWFRVNFEALGLTTYKLLLYTKNIDPVFSSHLHTFCHDHKNIDYLVECFGAWDFEIGVVAQSASDVMELTRTLYDRFGESVKIIKVLPLLKTLKWRQVPW